LPFYIELPKYFLWRSIKEREFLESIIEMLESILKMAISPGDSEYKKTRKMGKERKY
jgi:hypothetical protein